MSDKVVCPECDGVGTIEVKNREETCRYCKGRGFVAKELSNDSEEI